MNQNQKKETEIDLEEYEEYVLTLKDILTLLKTGDIRNITRRADVNSLTIEFANFKYSLYISLEKHDFWGRIDVNVQYNGDRIFNQDFVKNKELEKIFTIYKKRKTNDAVRELKQKIKEFDADNDKRAKENNDNKRDELI